MKKVGYNKLILKKLKQNKHGVLIIVKILLKLFYRLLINLHLYFIILI